MSVIKDLASVSVSTASSPLSLHRSILAESLEDYHYEGMIRLAAIDGRLHLSSHFDDDYEWTNSEVGRGASSVVRVAERAGGRSFDGEINPLRCVKSCLKVSRVGRDPEEIEEQLQRECSIYLSVDHPNIARLIDIYEDDFNVTMVMEYCLGGTLEARISSRGCIAEATAQEWSFQLLSAVRHLHHKDIAHRDIKPLNIVFSDESDTALLKLIDFDISTTCPDLDTGDMLRGPVGTRGYMSPEMFDCLEDTGIWYCTKTDLWSTGVTVFKMLCGKEAFNAPTHVMQLQDTDDGLEMLEEDWVQDIRTGNYSFSAEIWSTVSLQAKDLVKQLLTVQPQKRPTAMEALGHEWIRRKRDEHVNASLPEGVGTDVLNALVSFCEVSDELRYMLQKLSYSKVDFEVQQILPIFGVFDQKAIGCVDAEDFAAGLQALKADITEAQSTHLFDRLLGCFAEKAGTSSEARTTLQYSELMAATLPIITMPTFVQSLTDGHGVGLSVLDVEHGLRAAFNLDAYMSA